MSASGRTSAEAHAPGRGSPLLELVGVSKTYGRRSLFGREPQATLTDINLHLEPGEIVALVGESGSGKSSILKLISRITPPSGGRILWKGRDLLAEEPSRPSMSYRGEVQMVFQDPFASLNPFHSLEYTLSRPLLLHGIVESRRAATPKVLELLEDVGLSPGREFLGKFPYELSGGQRQRVAIARALAVRPSLILADEPVSMLDVSIRIGILNLLDDLRRNRGITVLLVTHDLASARYLADRIVVLYAGEVVEAGPSEALLARPLHPYTKLLLESVPTPERRWSAGPQTQAAPGALPQDTAPPSQPTGSRGCRFRARCPEAEARCAELAPPWVELPREGRGRGARCHLLDPGPARSLPQPKRGDPPRDSG